MKDKIDLQNLIGEEGLHNAWFDYAKCIKSLAPIYNSLNRERYEFETINEDRKVYYIQSRSGISNAQYYKIIKIMSSIGWTYVYDL